MEISYWESRWRNNRTGFHVNGVFPTTVDVWDHFSDVNLNTVLVPLCGKSHDMLWLDQKGAEKIIGIEAIAQACEEFFKENGDTEVEPEKTHSFNRYQKGTFELWQGDFFKMSKKLIANPLFVFDRAALVALPPEMRTKYASKIDELTSHSESCTQFLHTFEYNQSKMSGPPFAVSENEVFRLYDEMWHIKQILKRPIIDRLEKYKHRGLKEMDEVVYRLDKR